MLIRAEVVRLSSTVPLPTIWVEAMPCYASYDMGIKNYEYGTNVQVCGIYELLQQMFEIYQYFQKSCPKKHRFSIHHHLHHHHLFHSMRYVKRY